MTSKIISIPSSDGTLRDYTIHKFPPTKGRDIVLAYPLGLISKNPDYDANEAAMRKLMAYVEFEGVRLDTDELINQHVAGWFELVQIEYETLKFNCEFLQDVGFIDTAKTVALNAVTEILQSYMASKEKDFPEVPKINLE